MPRKYWESFFSLALLRLCPVVSVMSDKWAYLPFLSLNCPYMHLHKVVPTCTE